MSDEASPSSSSYGDIDGVSVTEDVIERLVEDVEKGFPNAKFAQKGQDAQAGDAQA